METQLVRDKLPEIMLTEGRTIEVRTAKGREYEFMLSKKLEQDVKDFLGDRKNIDKIAEITEVLHCLADYNEIDWDKVEETRKKKIIDRGSFKKKIILEKVE
jgi:predicted house-cleaning noncanonical NTP pyrophosphatase (MazG superfamily)